MTEAQISRPGVYEGFSTASFDGHERTAVYVAMRDGVRIAIDVVRPTNSGILHGDALPVLWSHTPYTRSVVTDEGVIAPSAIEGWGRMLPVLAHGYIIAQADIRGGGASFGQSNGMFSTTESDDAYEITEWLAAQEWCDGNVGMWGRSYLGITQLLCASRQPPHLKAIFPEMAWWDAYDVLHPGGILRDDLAAMWSAGVRGLDLGLPLMSEDVYGKPAVAWPAAPVDADADGSLIRAARRDHHRNRDVYALVSGSPYRDSLDADGQPVWSGRSPSMLRDEIASCDVAIYNYVGWYDGFTRDACLAFTNLTNPKKLLIDPNFHGEYFLPSQDRDGSESVCAPEFDLAAEQRRWFDYWLKGVDNGIMAEPPVTYWMLGADDADPWRTATSWPVSESASQSLYFGSGPADSIDSSNDGRLVSSVPPDGADTRVVDLSTTTGLANRWANLYGGGGRVTPIENGRHLGYPDLADNDRRGLTYTGARLEAPVELVGHPVVYLWLEAETEVDVFCHLEEVLPGGFSRYLSEGCLRSSHRAEAEPTYNYLEMPWHPSGHGDLADPADGPMALAFDLQPIGTIIATGSRLRITITNAELGSHEPLDHAAAPRVTVVFGPQTPSRVELPVTRGVLS